MLSLLLFLTFALLFSLHENIRGSSVVTKRRQPRNVAREDFREQQDV